MNTAADAKVSSGTNAVTTTVKIVLSLQVVGSPAEVARYRAALECLADVMRVQAEDGLWSAGYEDGGSEETPNVYVADINGASVDAVLIQGTDLLTDLPTAGGH